MSDECGAPYVGRLACGCGGCRLYTLELPWARPPLRSNDRMHWRVHAAKVAEVRQAIAVLAKAAKIPKCDRMTVQLHYAPGHRKRMDSHNLHPTVKAAVDALAKGPRSDWVGLQLVPDDTDEFVTVLPPRIVRPPAPGPRCWLTVEVDR